jgi:hypothetical protein
MEDYLLSCLLLVHSGLITTNLFRYAPTSSEIEFILDLWLELFQDVKMSPDGSRRGCCPLWFLAYQTRFIQGWLVKRSCHHARINFRGFLKVLARRERRRRYGKCQKGPTLHKCKMFMKTYETRQNEKQQLNLWGSIPCQLWACKYWIMWPPHTYKCRVLWNPTSLWFSCGWITQLTNKFGTML